MGEQRDRVTDAALRCIARWGIAKTTLDDVAREAGCSRATIYRTFSGGKAEVIAATARGEAERARTEIDHAVAGAASLEDLLVAGILAGSRFLAGHEALRFLLAHEPDVVLPHLAFRNLDRVFAVAQGVAAPHLARFLPESEVARAAEWVTRVVLAYALNPSAFLDPTDEADCRRLVRTYLTPALAGTTTATPTTTTTTRS